MSEAPKRPPEGAARDDVERVPEPSRGEQDVEGTGGESGDQAAIVSPELGRTDR